MIFKNYVTYNGKSKQKNSSIYSHKLVTIKIFKYRTVFTITTVHL